LVQELGRWVSVSSAVKESNVFGQGPDGLLSAGKAEVSGFSRFGIQGITDPMGATGEQHKPSLDSRPFLKRVRGEMHRLHPSERRLAEFVSNFPGELASYTASELARLANVSNATVTRFIKRLGYANYEQARRHVRSEKRTGSRLFLTPATGGKTDNSVEAHVAQGQDNIGRTFSSIPEMEIEAVAQAMLQARKTWVIGFRTSHSFATYFQWQATQVLENIAAIPGGGETLGEHLVSLRDKDLVILFGLRRRIARMADIIAQIKKSGAKLLYITDEGVPKDTSVEWHFRCETQASGPLFNHVAVMAVCHIIVTTAIELSGAAGRKRLTAIEVANDALDELSTL
jgi:DNA-binding MurR/RpiR family transcriptional regulator